MKAVLVINYASEEDIGKKTSIHLLNEENEWVEDVVIKPMPNKRVPDGSETDQIYGCYVGWNACIDEILGETE